MSTLHRHGQSTSSGQVAPPGAGVTLRPAIPADFPAVAVMFGSLHLYNAGLDPRFALADEWRTLLYEHFTRTVDAHDALWLLAWAEHEPVGLLLMEHVQDSALFRHRCWAELMALYVAPSQRGVGLADRLIEEGIHWAEAEGLERIQLYVTRSNETARAFYHRCDFRPVQEIWRLELAPVVEHDHCPPTVQERSLTHHREYDGFLNPESER